jgi:hypothetical protein
VGTAKPVTVEELKEVEHLLSITHVRFPLFLFALV